MPANWDHEEHAERVKFMLAIARQVFDTPAEMIFGLSKVIAVTMVAHGKPGGTPEECLSATDDTCEIIKEYVAHSIALKGRLDAARNAKAN